MHKKGGWDDATSVKKLEGRPWLREIGVKVTGRTNRGVCGMGIATDGDGGMTNLLVSDARVTKKQLYEMISARQIILFLIDLWGFGQGLRVAKPPCTLFTPHLTVLKYKKSRKNCILIGSLQHRPGHPVIILLSLCDNGDILSKFCTRYCTWYQGTGSTVVVVASGTRYFSTRSKSLSTSSNASRSTYSLLQVLVLRSVQNLNNNSSFRFSIPVTVPLYS